MRRKEFEIQKALGTDKLWMMVEAYDNDLSNKVLTTKKIESLSLPMIKAKIALSALQDYNEKQETWKWWNRYFKEKKAREILVITLKMVDV